LQFYRPGPDINRSIKGKLAELREKAKSPEMYGRCVEFLDPKPIAGAGAGTVAEKTVLAELRAGRKQTHWMW
jgi:hypothetical protein